MLLTRFVLDDDFEQLDSCIERFFLVIERLRIWSRTEGDSCIREEENDSNLVPLIWVVFGEEREITVVEDPVARVRYIEVASNCDQEFHDIARDAIRIHFQLVDHQTLLIEMLLDLEGSEFGRPERLYKTAYSAPSEPSEATIELVMLGLLSPRGDVREAATKMASLIGYREFKQPLALANKE